jgi:arginine N-succinyltransferase
MFLIRRTKPEDLEVLFKFAKMVHFINLPADKDIIAEKIRRSRLSFRAAKEGVSLKTVAGDKSAVGASPLFMFSIEDLSTNNCLGTSMAVSRMGGPGHPNLSFMLQKKQFFSEDLQTGTTHTTAKLFLDESGPSEIGGLIIGPSSRRHPKKLGKQLSLIRFHYMGVHREQFGEKVLAEMMAPITPDGHNTLWEYLGRRFINLPYSEADKFCQYSREFMVSLLPREEIYLSLLPPEARKLVGQVGDDTIPARNMLEGIGFKYTGRIDPFDGGPHLEAVIDDIPPVRETRILKIAGSCSKSRCNNQGFVSIDGEDGNWRALHTPYRLVEGGRAIELPKEAMQVLNPEDADHAGVTPLVLDSKSALRGSAQKKAVKQKQKKSGDRPAKSGDSKKPKRTAAPDKPTKRTAGKATRSATKNIAGAPRKTSSPRRKPA